MVRVRRAECDLELVEPTEADEVRVLDYKREHFACGETVLNGGSLLGRMDSYPAWLGRLRSNRSRETVPRDRVVADTLLAVRRRDGRMVGIVDIRYELNDFLRQSAGHIGYGVRPSERRKGYATGILHLALIRAAERGLDAVLVACRPENSGSRRAIEKNGGILVRESPQPEGGVMLMFRIGLSGTEQLARVNLARARRLVARSGIVEAWREAGARVAPVGSFATGLLMTHLDVDFHVYTAEPSVSEGLRVFSRVCGQMPVSELTCRDLLRTDEACIEWHLRLRDEQDELWSIDLIHIRSGSLYDGFFERVAGWIREVLTPETRRAVLELKRQTPPAEPVMGIEYCRAVIEGGVRSREEFEQWRSVHREEGICRWCP